MKHVVQNERGMALAIAIVALVIVGALIAGAFFSGTQEQRVAENVRRVQASFGVAEEGVYDIVRTWDSTVAAMNVSKTWYCQACGSCGIPPEREIPRQSVPTAAPTAARSSRAGDRVRRPGGR